MQVRCSGEQTGCNRCQSLRCECIYEESRVGKVQGNRGRRRKIRTDMEHQGPQQGPQQRQQQKQQQGQQQSAAPEKQQNSHQTPDDRMRRASRSLSAGFTPLSSLPSSTEEEQTINGAQEDDLAANWTEPADATFPSDILASAGPDDCSFFTDFEEFSGRDTLYASLQQQSLSCVPDLAALNDFDTTGLRKDGAASAYFPTATTAAVPDSHAVLDAILPGRSGGGPHQRSGSAQLHHHHRQHQTYYNKSNDNVKLLLPH